MSDLARELAFYKQQCNQAGRRVLKLQQENAQVRTEARRSRLLAKLIGAIHRLTDGHSDAEVIGPRFLQIVLGTLGVDSGLIMRSDLETGDYTLRYTLGLKDALGQRVGPLRFMEGSGYCSSNCPGDEPTELLCRKTGVSYLLWAFDEMAQTVLVLGNYTEDRFLKRPFEAGDTEIVQVALQVYLDVVKRRQRNQQLIEAKAAADKANRAKSDFLANMSHELRTPLNHIIGFTELVAGSTCGPLNDLQMEYLSDALYSSHHLLSLINDILDLSKIEAGKLELRLLPLELEPLLQNSLIIIKEKALKKRVRLTTEINGIPATITADQRKLKQILYNLLSNAVKFTPENGEICMGASSVQTGPAPWRAAAESDSAAPGQWVQIWVRDSGKGICPADLERIFKPFEQTEQGVRSSVPGTGLGLSLTKCLVELHGGQICAKSKGEGQGSYFSFTLPV